MASINLSGNRENFVGLRSCPPVDIKTADGNVLTARKMGHVMIRVHTATGKTLALRIDDVYYHPAVASNLLSTETLTKRHGWKYGSTPDGSFLRTPKGSELPLSTKGADLSATGSGAGACVRSGRESRCSGWRSRWSRDSNSIIAAASTISAHGI